MTPTPASAPGGPGRQANGPLRELRRLAGEAVEALVVGRSGWSGSPASLHQAAVRRALGAVSEGVGGFAPPELAEPLPGEDEAELRLLGHLSAAARGLPVEVLGQVYESLLDKTAQRAEAAMAALAVQRGRVCWVSLATLEQWREAGELIARVAAATHRSERLLRTALEGFSLATAPAGLERAQPFLALVAEDVLGRPQVVSRGGVYLGEGDARWSSGSHYTPAELADEVVGHTLDPLLAEASGPAELRICDPAMGGGAFLLAAARRLAERFGPDALGEACQQALCGVDRDPLAVEVARLSLLLLAGGGEELAARLRERLRVGDALVGRARRGDQRGVRMPVPPLHWFEAFPDVFERGGFDALVGNPPFLGGSFITGTLGARYRSYLVRHVAGGKRGNADLCAYFFLRAHELLRPGGRCGLVATNTIAEGDTRSVGLEQLVSGGATIYRADRLRPWPGEAATKVSLVWFRRGADPGPAVLDGEPVEAVDDRLHPRHQRPAPRPLAANHGLAFNGTKIYGQGFLLSPAEARAMIDADSRYAAVLRPYLSGDDVQGRPDLSAARWVICFHDWPLERAAEYPNALALVEQRVKPERERLRGRNNIGTRRAETWWQFGAPAGGIYQAAAGLERVLVKVLHTHTHAVVAVDSGCIFSHALAVFVRDDPALLAVLQSCLHELWALEYGSSLGDAPRYTLSKTFETFPLPPLTPRLKRVGAEFEAYRRELLLHRKEGLTPLHRRLHDPDETAADVGELRHRQAELDHAVARAYGWADLDLAHGHRTTPRGPRYTVSEEARLELLERLYQRADA